MNTHIKYSANKVFESTLKYFKGNELATKVWMEKYALKNIHNDLFLELTPDDMHSRIAKAFSLAEKKYNSPTLKQLKKMSAYGQNRKPLNENVIFELLKDFKYIIPQGNVMAGLGNKKQFISLSNCVVLPEIYDSYGGIMETDHQLVQVLKRRCGAGIDISSLRPKDTMVKNAANTSSGAVSFVKRYSDSTAEVAQQGRRGALMISMDIKHPDIKEFIYAKQEVNKLTSANLSVKLSDEFMRAVEQKIKFELQFPILSKNPKVKKSIYAVDLWNDILQCAFSTGEPGILFWDAQHHYSTSSIYPEFKNIGTNPCAEIAMQGADSCRLIALNLFGFVDNPFTSNASFNYKIFYEITYEAMRLSDDLVDLELEAIQKILIKIENDPEPYYIKETEKRIWKLIYKNTKNGRRTGLGFTALADAFAALGFNYGSEESLSEVKKIMQCKCKAEFDSSIDMAIERGPFKGFNSNIEKKSSFISMLKKEFPSVYKRMIKYGRRNISISTVSPSGSVSILTQTSSGIEPVYMLNYIRRKKTISTSNAEEWVEYEVEHPKLKLWKEVTGINNYQKSPYYVNCAMEIPWQKRLKIQAIVQKYTTHSVSSTINLPENTDKKTIGKIFIMAWKMGLKGVTIYREGSRDDVLKKSSSKKKNAFLQKDNCLQC